MDPLEIGILSGCVIALVILVWRRPIRSPAGQLLPRSRVQPLHRVRRGRVHVRGRIRAAEQTLKGPLSGQAVVGFRVIIERRDGTHHWSPMLDRCEVADFVLEDEGATARVNGAGALLVLGEAVTGLPPTAHRFPAAVPELLTRHCQFTPADHEAPRYRWSELRLVEGDAVHVLGDAVTVPARDGQHMLGGGAYRGTPTEVRLEGRGEPPLVICDRDRQGLLALLALPGGERLLPRR